MPCEGNSHHILAGGACEVRLNRVCKDLASTSRELRALAEMLGMSGDSEDI